MAAKITKSKVGAKRPQSYLLQNFSRYFKSAQKIGDDNHFAASWIPAEGPGFARGKKIEKKR